MLAVTNVISEIITIDKTHLFSNDSGDIRCPVITKIYNEFRAVARELIVKLLPKGNVPMYDVEKVLVESALIIEKNYENQIAIVKTDRCDNIFNTYEISMDKEYYFYLLLVG